ncbi:unnamed protein product [Closterium sp. Naga37s-1]|nr:unnamed protein product [Closterium sp. Naga37s-1]
MAELKVAASGRVGGRLSSGRGLGSEGAAPPEPHAHTNLSAQTTSPRRPPPQLAFPRSVSGPASANLSASPSAPTLPARQQFPSSKSLPTSHDPPVVPSDESSATAAAVQISAAARVSASSGTSSSCAAGAMTASRAELVIVVEPSYPFTPHPPSFPPSPTAATSRLRLSRFRSTAPSAALAAVAAPPASAADATSATAFYPAGHVDSSRPAHTRPRPNLRVDLPSLQSHCDSLSTDSQSNRSPDSSPAPSPPFTVPLSAHRQHRLLLHRSFPISPSPLQSEPLDQGGRMRSDGPSLPFLLLHQTQATRLQHRQP